MSWSKTWRQAPGLHCCWNMILLYLPRLMYLNHTLVRNIFPDLSKNLRGQPSNSNLRYFLLYYTFVCGLLPISQVCDALTQSVILKEILPDCTFLFVRRVRASHGGSRGLARTQDPVLSTSGCVPQV